MEFADRKVQVHETLEHKYVKEESNGRLTVVNGKNESVIVAFRIQLLDEPSNYSVPTNTDTIQYGKDVVNMQHDIVCNIRLEPQQRQEINYRELFNQFVK